MVITRISELPGVHHCLCVRQKRNIRAYNLVGLFLCFNDHPTYPKLYSKTLDHRCNNEQGLTEGGAR